MQTSAKPSTSKSELKSEITTEANKKPDPVTSEEMFPVPAWNEKEIYEQFINFEYNKNNYVTRCYRISDDIIGEKLSELKISGQDFSTLEMHESEVSLYKIKDISPDCALAVQFKGNSNYYSYTSSSYFPATLGDMLDDLNFEKNAIFKDLYLKRKNITAKLYNSSILIKILSENRNTVCISNDIPLFSEYSVSVSIPSIGITGKSFGITDNGYLTTNIFEYQHAYYIGKEILDKFIESIEYVDAATSVIDYGPGEEE